MKILLRLFVTFCSLFCTELFAGSLKVNLSPAAAVTAGAQWRVDGGTWRASGYTATNLTDTTHPVIFKTVTGWIAPAAVDAVITSGATTTLSATYVQAASLQITLTPTNGRWRIDGGSWRNSDVTLTGLTPGNHTIDYSSVSGYISPTSETVSLVSGQTTTLVRGYTQLSLLTLTLTPTTAQWRVDGGSWKASGATVANLTPGAHTIDYNALTGYSAPASESVTLISGQTLALSRSYVPRASLKITLSPTTAQWRVDGGAWKSSAATVANLTPGAHTVDYNTLTGYSAPASESVTLISGQTTALSRSYTQLASLKITLSPTAAQWRVDGGAWTASAATVTNLTPGAHTVDYNALAGYSAPASESVTLVSGQTLSLARSYSLLAKVSVTLTPSSGQWNVDGGAWQSSGATITNLALGSHTINYSALNNYASPAPESVSLTAGQSLILARSYTQLAQISISLVPSSGQWRTNGGAWQPSDSSLSVLPGSQFIEYVTLALYDSPANETITLAAGENFTATRGYITQKPTLRLDLTPSTGQWRVDGGAWQPSGALVSALDAGIHSIDYADIGGSYNPLPPETLSLALRENATLVRSYPIKPPAALTITLDPTSAQWRVDGGAWQASSAIAENLTYDAPHTIDYAAVAGYSAPASESVTIASGQTLTLNRTYVQLTQLSVTLTPATGEWSVDGGTWQPSGATVIGLAPGSHTINYKPLGNHASPATETISLAVGQTLSLLRSYIPLATFSVTLNPSSAQWRLVGSTGSTSPWFASGFPATNLPLGTQTVEYTSVFGYITLPSETVTLVSGVNPSLARTYAPLATFSVTLNPSSAEWRLVNSTGSISPWFASGYSSPYFPLGTQTVEYSSVPGYITPPSETVTLVSGVNPSLARTYAPLASFSVTLNPSAEWRLVNSTGSISPWFASGFSAGRLPLGTYTVEYSTFPGYITPPSETVTLVSGVNPALARTYAPLASFSVTLNPSAEWRLVNSTGSISPWFSSGYTLPSLPLGTYTVEYSTFPGYIAPPSETVTLVSGVNPTLARTYAPLASFSVTLNPSSAQWRLVSSTGSPSPWFTSGYSLPSLPLGTYTVEYSTVPGYITPPSETVTLVSGPNPTLSRTYTPLASFGVTLNPSSAQWRIDGGAWTASGTVLSNLAPGVHTIDYSAVENFASPPSETITLVSGSNAPISRSYAFLVGSISVTLNPSSAQWRIDGSGQWLSSGAALFTVPIGTHTIEYSPVSGYIAPPTETVTITGGTFVPVSRSYTPVPLGSIQVTLNPSSAQWRVDGLAWLPSGFVSTGIPLGTHTIDFSPVAGYITPPSETVTIVSGVNPSLTRTYTALASFSVTLSPSIAQWRLVGSPGTSAWFASGFVLPNLPLGNYTVEYSSVSNYLTPPSETVTLVSGTNPTLSRTYGPLATFSVLLTPSSAQWRLVGSPGTSAWFASGSVLPNIPLGNYTVEYSNVAGYAAPPSETVTLVSGINPSFTRTYTQLASLYIDLGQAPSGAQWRIDGGTWNLGATVLTNLTLGVHTIEYSNAAGYITPPTTTITLVQGPNNPPAPTYIPLASLYVNLGQAPFGAQWRIDGGAWNLGATILNNLSLGAHTVDYFEVVGYITPPSVAVSLVSGPNNSPAPTYIPLASLYVNLGQAPFGAQWRIDGGAWNLGATVLNNLSLGAHTVDYFEVVGYITPPSVTVSLVSGPNNPPAPTYIPLASLYVDLSQAPFGAQWRIDGGAWNPGATVLNNLSLGVHTIEYSDVVGYITPPSEVVTLVSGSNPVIMPAYVLEQPVFDIIKSFEDTGGSPTLFLGQDGVIYGFTEFGGNIGSGHVFKVNRDGSGFQILHSFPADPNDGKSPSALIEGPGGVLYGTTAIGSLGTTGGTLFKLNKDGTGYVRLYSFNNSYEGSWPKSLLAGSDGKLYGTTATGGVQNDGVIFRINTNGTAYTVLTGLAGTNLQGLVEGPTGILYGVTKWGGATAWGSIFRMNKDGSNLTVVKSFAGGADGSGPNAGLLIGSDGLLYGNTTGGGAANQGLVFRINPNGSGYQVLHHFLGGASDGAQPQYTLSEDANGVLYGTTRYGGTSNRGTLFKMNKDGTGHSILLHLSDGVSEGGLPNHRVLLTNDGTLVCSTISGGTAAQGVIFKINLDGSGLTPLKQLGAPAGNRPLVPVIVASDNAIYGTTYNGGISSKGTMFKISQDGTGYTVMHHFGINNDGANPLGKPIECSDGLIYGTTFGGSSTGRGSVFRINKDGTGYALLHQFSPFGGDGRQPRDLIEASDGLLYGTTDLGGTAERGILFRMNKDGSNYVILQSFIDDFNHQAAYYPRGNVVEGNDGRLYGTTYAGGISGMGTVYVINKNGTAYGILRHFAGGTSDGANPNASLLQGSDGLLYGTTSAGGAAGLGTVFKVKPDGTGYVALKQFLGGTSDGANPSTACVVERNGVIYGVTTSGGTFNKGVIYALNKDGSGYQVLINFGAGESDGVLPQGLFLTAGGLLYGSTTYGGGGGGTIFRFQPN